MHLARAHGRFAHVAGQAGRGGSLGTLGLLAALLVLTPLAYARPPDPLWIEGIYDDGDLDDVAVAVIQGEGVVQCAELGAGKPMASSGRGVDAGDETAAPRASHFSLNVRAPPHLIPD